MRPFLQRGRMRSLNFKSHFPSISSKDPLTLRTTFLQPPLSNELSKKSIHFKIIFEFAKAYIHFLLSMQKSRNKRIKKFGFGIFQKYSTCGLKSTKLHYKWVLKTPGP